MTTTTLATASKVAKWDSSYFSEYIRTSGFKPYMGKGTNSIFQVKYELTPGGKTINIPLITRLSGAGVTGTSTLVGSEEALGNYNMSISVDWLRNAVEIKKPEEHWTEMDLRGAARDALMNWSDESLRDALIAAFTSINGVAFGTATATQRNTWLTGNTDRALFGASKSNTKATHALSLTEIDGTNDKLTAAAVSLMKRMAKTADPHIRPHKVKDGSGKEYFVLFAGSLPFRDLKEDSVMQTANREARERGVGTNPIFQDGDLIYDGVIIREIPEIPVVAGAGAGGTVDVAPVFFCGAQAVCLAWGQEPKSTKKTETDYGFSTGVGIEECRGIEKTVFNSKDHGMLTGWFSAVADS